MRYFNSIKYIQAYNCLLHDKELMKEYKIIKNKAKMYKKFRQNRSNFKRIFGKIKIQ